MRTQLAALFPLLGVLAGPLSGPPSDHAARGAAATFGPRLATAYDALFNDLLLVRQERFGVTRDPLSNAHHGQGRESTSLTDSQTQLETVSSSVRASGYEFEYGLFTAFRTSMLPYVDSSPIRGDSIAARSEAYAIAARRSPLSRVIEWIHTAKGNDSGWLFPLKSHLQANYPRELMTFGDQVFAAANAGPAHLTKDGFDIYAAPIRLEHTQCLSCHVDKKLNDVAAVMAFVFHKKD